ncbi:hypothetical protein [Flavobacterium rakeshii]|nr:hypothetical protein [Flavobacterium rakeshii]
MSNVIFVTRELLDKLCNANACEQITQDKVRTIIRHNSKDYVITGSMSSGKKGNIAAYAHECIIRTKYTGELKPLCSVDHYLEVQAGFRERGYDGRLVYHKGKQYVLFGEQTTFKPIKEHSNKIQKQPSLFG